MDSDHMCRLADRMLTANDVVITLDKTKPDTIINSGSTPELSSQVNGLYDGEMPLR